MWKLVLCKWQMIAEEKQPKVSQWKNIPVFFFFARGAHIHVRVYVTCLAATS